MQNRHLICYIRYLNYDIGYLNKHIRYLISYIRYILNKISDIIYSKIPILRPPFGLPKNGLIREVVLISNIILQGKYHLGPRKTGLNSEVVLILGGLNSNILLYKE